MATTYLDLTNILLREMNEVVLTSSTFANAIGIQQHVKDAVSRAYFEICVHEPKWPFLAAAESGSANNAFGNVYVDTAAGQRWYELKASSSSVKDDYGSVDWNHFYITTIGTAGATEPFTSQELSFATIENWKDYFRASENIDAASGSPQYGTPCRVISSLDKRQFGLSPIPDKVYRVWFFAWEQPTPLSLYSDEIALPEMYSNVILDKARYYIWQFKDNPNAAAFALADYSKGFDKMYTNLIGNLPLYMKDDRVRVV